MVKKSNYSDEPKKKVAVLFSSGLDSTYLIWKNLEEGNEVFPIYVEIKNNVNKTKIEKQNVKMLFEIFREKYGYRKINEPYFITEVSIMTSNDDLLFTQLPIWIFSLAYLPINKIDEIQIGYVMNDDAISYIDDIKKFYKAHAWLHKSKQPKLVFPLIKIYKQEMMRNLPLEYKNYITSCENPELLPYHMHVKGTNRKLQFYKPCGDCVPCKRIIRDNLNYNGIYGDMISEHNKKISLGNRFTHLKKVMPEIFGEINEVIQNNLRKESSYTVMDKEEIKHFDDIDIEV